MSQDDYDITNAPGATVRGDINSQLAAVVSNNSGATEPTTKFAYMWWVDTTLAVIKMRNAANSAWITLANIGSTLAELATAQTFTKAQRGAVVTLTDAATVAVDMSLGNNFTLTLGGNRTIGNPTNMVAGQSGTITVIQDGTGSRTLSYSSYWAYADGVSSAPALTTTAAAVDRIDYYVRSATVIEFEVRLDTKNA